MVVLISQLWILGIEIEATIAEDEDSWLMNTWRIDNVFVHKYVQLWYIYT